MADPREIAKTLKVVAASYPHYDFTEDTVRVYVGMLQDLPIEDIQTAVIEHLATSKWFPSVAEIRKGAVNQQLDRQNIPDAYEAWNEVTRKIIDYGHRNRPTFSHPAITAAVRGVGGWEYLCMSENQMADRSHFVKAYDRLIERGNRDAFRPPMLEQIRKLTDILEERTLPDANPQLTASGPDESQRTR